MAEAPGRPVGEVEPAAVGGEERVGVMALVVVRRAPEPPQQAGRQLAARSAMHRQQFVPDAGDLDEIEASRRVKADMHIAVHRQQSLAEAVGLRIVAAEVGSRPSGR